MGARLASVWIKEPSSSLSKQRAYRLEHWIVGFDPPETLDTLPARDPQTRMSSGLLLEHVHECCLADARFARYEDHLSLAAQCFLQIVVQPRKPVLTPHHIPAGFV